MNTLKILKQARELISKPENWTQGVPARNAKGDDILYSSEEAVSWDSMGAVARVTQDIHGRSRELRKQISEVSRELGQSASFSVVQHDETHTHAEVLALFDEAIARLEK